jgi:hypothetical protein
VIPSAKLLLFTLALFFLEISAMADPADKIDARLSSLLAARDIDILHDTWVRDWSNRIPEFGAEKVLWIIDRRTGRSFIAASFDGADWVQTNTPDFGALAHGLTIAEPTDRVTTNRLVRVATALLYDPRFVVCDRAFAAKPEAVLKTYLAGRKVSLDDLRRVCIDETRVALEGGIWRLETHILDYTGAVRRLRLHGRRGPTRVDGCELSEIVPAGTFYFADEF